MTEEDKILELENDRYMSSISSVIKNGKVSINNLKANSSVFKGKSVDQIALALINVGYDVTVKASTKSKKWSTNYKDK